MENNRQSINQRYGDVSWPWRYLIVRGWFFLCLNWKEMKFILRFRPCSRSSAATLVFAALQPLPTSRTRPPPASSPCSQPNSHSSSRCPCRATSASPSEMAAPTSSTSTFNKIASSSRTTPRRRCPTNTPAISPSRSTMTRPWSSALSAAVSILSQLFHSSKFFPFFEKSSWTAHIPIFFFQVKFFSQFSQLFQVQNLLKIDRKFLRRKITPHFGRSGTPFVRLSNSYKEQNSVTDFSKPKFREGRRERWSRTTVKPNDSEAERQIYTGTRQPPIASFSPHMPAFNAGEIQSLRPDFSSSLSTTRKSPVNPP